MLIIKMLVQVDCEIVLSKFASLVFTLFGFNLCLCAFPVFNLTCFRYRKMG